MTRFAAILTTVMLTMLWLPAAGTAGNTAKQSAGKQDAQSSAASGARSETDASKKPDQGNVQSRGLFSKKKKKQVGGSAGHSQPAEQTDALPH